MKKTAEMMENIRMIGFDLDGTLLTTDKRITAYTEKVLRTAAEKGIVVLPATGRPVLGLPKEIREFPEMKYAVTSNGARIVEMASGKTLFEKTVSAEKTGKILDIFEKYDTLREVYYDGKGYVDRSKWEQIHRYIKIPAMVEYVLATRTPAEHLEEIVRKENRGADKVQAFFSSVEEKWKAIKEVQKLGGVEATGALEYNVEVNGEGVHKGAALLWLGERLGIAKKEIMAFGDGANDTIMLQTAGVGVAMSNAVPEAIEAADYITGSNDEDGAARFIEEYFGWERG